MHHAENNGPVTEKFGPPASPSSAEPIDSLQYFWNQISGQASRSWNSIWTGVANTVAGSSEARKAHQNRQRRQRERAEFIRRHAASYLNSFQTAGRSIIDGGEDSIESIKVPAAIAPRWQAVAERLRSACSGPRTRLDLLQVELEKHRAKLSQASEQAFEQAWDLLNGFAYGVFAVSFMALEILMMQTIASDFFDNGLKAGSFTAIVFLSCLALSDRYFSALQAPAQPDPVEAGARNLNWRAHTYFGVLVGLCFAVALLRAFGSNEKPEINDLGFQILLVIAITAIGLPCLALVSGAAFHRARLLLIPGLERWFFTCWHRRALVAFEEEIVGLQVSLDRIVEHQYSRDLQSLAHDAACERFDEERRKKETRDGQSEGTGPS